MQITAIIVTYADRFNLLNQVIDSCFKSSVSNIVVVDNDSHENSKSQLRNLLENHKDTITVLWNTSNLGSAKAYKQGLQEANRANSCDYIWLLDDDNKPKEKALETLKKYWKKKPKDVAALLSFRPDREQYKQAVIENNPNLVLGKKNSFSGFHFKQKITKIFSKKATTDNKRIVGEIAYAPYGGMFFHKSIIDEIGYPNEDYFLYSDDHDWSYRITKANKKIYLVLNSIIDDIDTSWGLIDKKSTTFTKIKNAPSLRVYYNVRNRMLFEKNYLISNKLSYNINKFTFTLLLFCFCFRSKNFKVFKKAVNHANNNNLVKF
ncbi:Glycosyltransferase, GT2 family [Polaribacter sp. Hel1_33_78]|jgi:GT2 family glycosyltransferase|uniref:glycosyltransferase n=1 Tax=Polaribacter sp. Hel1_33_78 TaxID=1336804 RepID=UPI00087BCF0C|nr:glycosyltransferase [Polaribacter sp. Hel1_33_78]SDU24264.1 Glycosyltransferase, GT2 family [Polaribacter sp. Hel1_33_78]